MIYNFYRGIVFNWSLLVSVTKGMKLHFYTQPLKYTVAAIESDDKIIKISLLIIKIEYNRKV